MAYTKKGYIDHSGKRFGCFSVLNLGPKKRGSRAWLVQCDCGALSHKTSGELFSQNLFCRSCPFEMQNKLRKESQTEPPKCFKDLKDKVFEKWTVLERDTSKLEKAAYWFCRCECGTTKSVVSANLIKGKSKSCGNSKCKKPSTGRPKSSKLEKQKLVRKSPRLDGSVFGKKCPGCLQTIPVKVIRNTNSKYYLRLVSDGRYFCKKLCPDCLKRPKPSSPKTPSKRAPTPASWVRRGQTRRIAKFMDRHFPEYKWNFTKMLGMPPKEFVRWIESQFHLNPANGEQMKWETVGISWELDHRVEIAMFNKSNFEEFKKAFHYTNVGPIWKSIHEEKTKRFNDSRKCVS